MLLSVATQMKPYIELQVEAVYGMIERYMVEKKEKKKKQTGKLKASIGAWWNSITQEPDSEKGSIEENSKKPQVKKPGKEKSGAAPKERAKDSGKIDSSRSAGQRGRRKYRNDAQKGVSDRKNKEELQPAGDDSALKPKAEKEKKGSSKPRPVRKVKKSDSTGRSRGQSTSQPQENSVAADDTNTVIKLLVNTEEPEECRLVLLENGRLESLHVTTVNRKHTKSNIYKGRIVAVEDSLQAAFVDYGTGKHGFLPFSEIHPEYYKQDLSDKTRSLVEKHQWKKLSIGNVVERGCELLVQVVKEEVGTKGANMTTYLSLPGRCVVLMPGSDSAGISRKIVGETRRDQLRQIMNSLTIPEGIGWIVRTASIDITKTALSKDVNYLKKLWKEVKKKGLEMSGVGLIYQDHDCVLRFLREHFDPAIREILVDDQAAFDKVKEFVAMLPAKHKQVKVKLHRGARPIFNLYSVEDQIESIYQPKVNLPSGGSIVIDPTEALVSIDVNSGSTSKGRNFEKSIFQANIEAATELARQLRLRDLGGLVVVDFIDMRSKKNIREVEKQVKTAMKRDKAKVDISRISKFGLMQISRQKLGSPIEAGSYQVCEHCKGRGMVRSVETQALYYLRRIHTGASRNQVVRVEARFPIDVAHYLLNNKRQELLELETKYKTEVDVIPDPSLKPSENEIIYHKTAKEKTD